MIIILIMRLCLAAFGSLLSVMFVFPLVGSHLLLSRFLDRGRRKCLSLVSARARCLLSSGAHKLGSPARTEPKHCGLSATGPGEARISGPFRLGAVWLYDPHAATQLQ